MLTKFYVMCSYPDVHTVAAFKQLDEARDAFCEQYSSQTGEKNYYWTEADCDKHGRVGLTAQTECELCDLARAAEHEQAAKDADAEFDAQAVDGDPDAECERYEQSEREEYDRVFKRGLIAPSQVFLFSGKLVVSGECDPRYHPNSRICRVEAVEYFGAIYHNIPEAYREAWHKRDYAGMLAALVEEMGAQKVLSVLHKFAALENELEDELDPLNDLTD